MESHTNPTEPKQVKNEKPKSKGLRHEIVNKTQSYEVQTEAAKQKIRKGIKQKTTHKSHNDGFVKEDDIESQDKTSSAIDELSNSEPTKQKKRKYEETKTDEDEHGDEDTETIPSPPPKKKPKKYWTKEQKTERWRQLHAQMLREQEQTKYWNEHPLEHPAIKYLEQWKNNRKIWKFKKSRQVYLQQHVFNPTRIPESHFQILLEYLKEGKGRFFKELVKTAVKYVERKKQIDCDEEKND